MISQEMLATLKIAISSITKYKNTPLVKRSTEWGKITFEDIESDINNVLTVTSSLEEMPLDHLTDAAAEELQTHMSLVAELFERIDTFDLSQGIPNDMRNQIVREFKPTADGMHMHCSRWLPYLAYQRGDIAENISQLKSAISRAERQLSDAESYQNDKKEEVDKIVVATRKAAASAGVATFTDEFAEEAAVKESAAQKWFWGAILCSIATIIVIIVLYFTPALSADAANWQIVRNALMKVSVIAVLFNGAIWCARMYRAFAHQASTNRHRALSLQTFQAFVEATPDARTRDAVLLAATKSIFANVSTGLVGERTNVQDPSVQFLEIGKVAGDP